MGLNINPKVKKFLSGRSDEKLLRDICSFSAKALKDEGLYLIFRIQKKRSVSVSVVNGELNDITANSKSGLGVHGFDKSGASALVTSNTYPDIDIEAMVASVRKLISSSSKFDIKRNASIFSLPREINIMCGEYAHPLENYELDRIVEKVKTANCETISVEKSKLSVSTSASAVSDEYMIIRGDGTFSAFTTPRCAIFSTITVRDNLGTASVSAKLGSSDLSVLFDDKLHDDFMSQSRFFAEEALKLPSAPQIEPGKYRIVIDYALAKGLAHEAFGHAAEADLHKGSILWETGKFIRGRRVAAPEISITDGPIMNDYAWQPVGSNGNLRNTVEIVRDGIVEKSLCDVFSSEEAGVANENAERIESFDCPPIPRMTNIRLEHNNPVSIDKRFCDITPSDVNGLLMKNKLLAPEGDTLLLLGYRGGQVSPATGDFVFNCSMIYKMRPDGNPCINKPAIFAGKTLSALGSIMAAIGPVKWDALGTCGKSGQGVPSSGGSNYFLIIDKNEDITIG